MNAPLLPPVPVVREAAAFGAFYEAQRARALAFAQRRAPRVAEDLVQDAFVRVLGHWGRVPPAARGRYLLRVLRNLVIDHYRARGREPFVRLDDALGERPTATPAAPVATPPESVEQRETIRAVREAVQALPGDFRTTVLEYMDPGRTHAEMASRLGCAERTVSTRMFRARLRLRASLQRLAG